MSDSIPQHPNAPDWYVAGEKRRDEAHERLEKRVIALEAAVTSHAGALGAASGRKWGAFVGALAATIVSSLQLSQCAPASGVHAQPPTSVAPHSSQ